jgi:hypothetical protein
MKNSASGWSKSTPRVSTEHPSFQPYRDQAKLSTPKKKTKIELNILRDKPVDPPEIQYPDTWASNRGNRSRRRHRKKHFNPLVGSKNREPVPQIETTPRSTTGCCGSRSNHMPFEASRFLRPRLGGSCWVVGEEDGGGLWSKLVERVSEVLKGGEWGRVVEKGSCLLALGPSKLFHFR